MKTVGELLQLARLNKGITVNQLSRLTNIDTRYIKALEKDDYSLLPSTTFTKGFIRNISLALGKEPNELIAVFRRDYQAEHYTKQKNLTLGIHNRSKLTLNSHLLFVFMGVLVFFSYLIFQYRTVIIPPKLEIIQPQLEQVVTSPVIIEGVSTVDSVIDINDQQEVNTDESGHFLSKINLPTGNTQIKISATNRFGRVSTKTVEVIVVSQ